MVLSWFVVNFDYFIWFHFNSKTLNKKQYCFYMPQFLRQQEQNDKSCLYSMFFHVYRWFSGNFFSLTQGGAKCPRRRGSPRLIHSFTTALLQRSTPHCAHCSHAVQQLQNDTDCKFKEWMLSLFPVILQINHQINELRHSFRQLVCTKSIPMQCAWLRRQCGVGGTVLGSPACQSSSSSSSKRENMHIRCVGRNHLTQSATPVRYRAI